MKFDAVKEDYSIYINVTLGIDLPHAYFINPFERIPYGCSWIHNSNIPSSSVTGYWNSGCGKQGKGISWTDLQK